MKGSEHLVARLLAALCASVQARLMPDGDGYLLTGAADGRIRRVSADVVRNLLARGLLCRAQGEAVAASELAASWMKRRGSEKLAFRRQHDAVEPTRLPGPEGVDVLVNLNESPVATLARRPAAGGGPWLQPHAVAAAERLRRDFEIGIYSRG